MSTIVHSTGWGWGKKLLTKAQCLASYFGDPGKFSMFFFVVFQASTGKKLREKNPGKNFGTRRFDAKHSTTTGLLN